MPDLALDLGQMKAELDLSLQLIGCANSQLSRRRETEPEAPLV